MPVDGHMDGGHTVRDIETGFLKSILDSKQSSYKNVNENWSILNLQFTMHFLHYVTRQQLQNVA